MIRRTWIAAIAVLILAVPSFAEEDDGIMGNYRGTYTSGARANQPAQAMVVALGKDRFRAIIVIDVNGTTKRVLLDGEKPKDNPIVRFGPAKRTEPVEAASGTIQDAIFRGDISEGASSSKFEMKRVHIESPTLGMAPPEGAVVLSTPDQWQLYPDNWFVGENHFKVQTPSVVTREKFGDARYHVEFMCPFMPEERGQARGNSGVYIQGRYEVQVLDSFGEEPAWDYCGGIYKQSVPSTNASLPPLSWQTYDIDFTAPRFDSDGNKTANARITVRHNGILIHDDKELTDRTPGGMGGGELKEERLFLQHHRDAVEYRNVWVVRK